MSDSIRHTMIMVTAVLLAATAWLLSCVAPAQAQVECPPGFHFNPMSGTGCVQDDCGTIPESHFDYTGHCVCNEGYSGCSEPINDPGYDTASCFPFCPSSRLITCVSYLSTCPGEEPANTSTIEAVTEEEAPAETEEKPASDGTTSSVKDLAKDLSKFLAGSDNEDLKSRDAAVAAAAAAAVMASWMAAQLAAGANIDDLKKAIEMVRGGDKTKSVPAPGSGKPVTVKQDAPAKVPDAPPSSLPEQKKSSPQNGPASTLHDKKQSPPPVDALESKLRKDIEKCLELEKTNKQAQDALKDEHQSVSDTVKKLRSAFDAENITRCTDGIIEVGDTGIMVLEDAWTLGKADTKKDSKLWKSTKNVLKAYLRDLIKGGLKMGADQREGSKPEAGDLFFQPVGIKLPPGGVAKSVIIDLIEYVPIFGKVVGKGYDYFEQIYGMTNELKEHTRKIDAILQKKKDFINKQMDLEINIHDRQVDIDNAIYDRNKAEQALAEYLRSRGRTPGLPAR